jgi:hypothetical protein
LVGDTSSAVITTPTRAAITAAMSEWAPSLNQESKAVGTAIQAAIRPNEARRAKPPRRRVTPSV